MSPGATARAVSEARHSLVEKPLGPLVDKASADTHRVGNVGDGHAISDEENNPPASGTPSMNGGRPLPRQERLPFLWGEGQRQRGGASMSHSKAFQEAGWVFVVVCRQEEVSYTIWGGSGFLKEGMQRKYTAKRGRREH